LGTLIAPQHLNRLLERARIKQSRSTRNQELFVYFCPTCGRACSADSLARNGSEQPLHDSGPVGISATDELQLHKAQVQDVARICKPTVTSPSLPSPSKVQSWFSSRKSSTRWSSVSPNSAREVTRVSDEVGTQGKLGGQVSKSRSVEHGKNCVERSATSPPISQTRSAAIAQLTKVVALGDLSKMIEVNAQGEILELKTTVNGMVIRLRKLAEQVSRVSLEVGTFGNLDGQADVPDVEECGGC
ncbi:hypothetical protein FRC01_011013, partial [Tulasnella sp. 417]